MVTRRWGWSGWHRSMPGVILMGLIVLLVACGGGGGTDPGSDGDDDRGEDSEFYLLDLDTRELTAVSVLPALKPGDPYTTRALLFRRVVPSEGPAFHLALTECSRAQWRRIAGTTPWRDVRPGGIAGSIDDEAFPATMLCARDIDAAIAGWPLRRPTADEWRAACLLGAAQRFSWGDDRSVAAAGDHAAVRETLAAAVDPRPITSYAASPLGFYDLHGNAWELLADDRLIGGGWMDNLYLADARVTIATMPDLPHTCVGVRFVLVP